VIQLSRQTELLFQTVLVLIGLSLITLVILGLSRLSPSRLGALDGLFTWLQGKKTYIVSAGIIANELYSSYTYNTPFNFTAIMTALGLSTIRAGVTTAANQIQASVPAAVARAVKLPSNPNPDPR
jgi:hypothetical protein